jgi:hypothetical protein
MAANFPYPLKSWKLGGFRAIRDETTFDLGGLNVLVGANSAGKSSVLHSLLLVAQTLSNPTADRPLVLNGNLVRLGWASDCVHEQAGQDVTIGFGLDPTEISFGQGRPAMGEVSRIEVQSQFLAGDQSANFTLARSDVIAHLTEESGAARISVEQRSDSAARAALSKAGLTSDAAEQYADTIGEGVSGDMPEGTVGSYTRQFLPDTLAVVVNAYARELSDLLIVLLPRIGNSVPASLRKRLAAVSPPVAEFIGNFISESLDPSDAVRLSLDSPLSPEALSQLPDGVLVSMDAKRGWPSAFA